MRKLIKKILKESDDFDWVREVEVSIPFRDVRLSRFYDLKITDVNEFIKHAEYCGINNAEDIAYDTDYVKALERGRYESGVIYCGEDYEEHYEGEKLSLQLNFYDDDNKLIHSGYWVAENQEVIIVPYKKRQR